MKRNIIYIFYILLIFFSLIFLSPYFIYLLIKGRGQEAKERLGLVSFPDKEKLRQSQVIWLHGASVGEIKAAGKVMQKLKTEGQDNFYFFVTAMTPAGRDIARSELDDADFAGYIPVDFAPILYFFIRRLQPDMLLLLETEFWPALIQETHRRGGSIAVFNGRISDDSFSRYKIIKFLLHPFLDLIAKFYMQSEKDCQRIKDLGLSGDKVVPGWNIKYSGALKDAEEADDLFKIAGKRMVLVAGSTHSPEEKQLLDVYCNLKQKFQQLQEKNDDFPKPLLILAPRYVDRKEEIIDHIKARDLIWQQRSQGEINIEEDSEIFLLDTIGELMSAYKVSDIAFIGGTLAEIGGHNFLEPLACSSPVILGPHTEEIDSELKNFNQTEFVHQIENKSELTNLLTELLGYNSSDRSLEPDKDKAYQLLRQKGDKIKKHIGELFSLLPLGKEAKKILFIRLSALGDVIHTLPAFSLLSKKRPEYELHWLVEPLAAPLVKNNKYVDEAKVLPRSDWRGKERLKGLKRLGSVKNYLSELAEENYDLSLDLHGILKSAVPAYFSRPDIKYGPEKSREGSRLFYDRYFRKQRTERNLKHRIEENLELISSGLGCRMPEGRKKLDYGLQLPQNWLQILPGSLSAIINSDNGNNNIAGVIHPLSSWPSKNWVMERYRLLVERLLSAGVDIIISGGPGERSRIQQIFSYEFEREFAGKFYNAADELNLIELYGVLTRVNFFLGADTGPMHLAAAADTSVAAIMGPTLPERYGPYCQDKQIIRNENLDCLGCGEEKCPLGHHNCMQRLSVDEVAGDLKSLVPEISLHSGESKQRKV